MNGLNKLRQSIQIGGFAKEKEKEKQKKLDAILAMSNNSLNPLLGKEVALDEELKELEAIEFEYQTVQATERNKVPGNVIKEYEVFKTQKFKFLKNVKELVFKNVPAIHAYRIRIVNTSKSAEAKNTTIYCKEAFISDKDKQNLSDMKNDIPTVKACESAQNPGELIILYPFLDSEYFETVTVNCKLESASENFQNLEVEVTLELEVRTGIKNTIDLNAYRTKTYTLPSGLYRILLEPVNPNQKSSGCFFNIKYGSRRPLHIKGNRSQPFLIDTKEGEQVIFEAGLLESKDFVKFQPFSYKRPGNNSPFVVRVQQLQGESYVITFRQTTKVVFNDHFTRMLRYYVNNKNVEAIGEIEKSAKINKLTKIKNNAYLLKKKLDDEDEHKKALKFAIEERCHSLRIEEIIKSAESYNNDSQTSEIFKSKQLEKLIEEGKLFLKELIEEKELIDEIKELLVTLWIEVKKKREKFEIKQYYTIMQDFIIRGRKMPKLKSYYYFILELWYLISDYPPSIETLQLVQYNCFVFQMFRGISENTNHHSKNKSSNGSHGHGHGSSGGGGGGSSGSTSNDTLQNIGAKELSKLDPKFTIKSTQEDINQRKEEGKLLNSFFNYEPKLIYFEKKEKIGKLFMKAEEDLFEKIIGHILRTSQLTIKKLHEDQINHPRDMSQYIIDGNFIEMQKLLEISTVFSESEIDRSQRIIKAIQMNDKDYSDELNQIEIESIEKSKKQYLLIDPESESIFEEMTHLQIIKYLKAKDMNVLALIRDRVIIPEILFIGDKIKFDYTIKELPDSKLISEISKIGKEITFYMRKKKDLDSTLTIHEILTEQSITSDFLSQSNHQFTSEIDQYIRKRLIPVLERILNHSRKEESSTLFEIIDNLVNDKRINKLKKYIKESITLENLWTKDEKTLSLVRLRILISICLNKQLLENLFNSIFHQDISSYYKRNSFMRIQDARVSIIRLLHKFSKFPFSLVTTMERNEYKSDEF
eukprot:gene1914-1054_t